MYSGKELQRMDAATGNERRQTVDRRNDEACSRSNGDKRSVAASEYTCFYRAELSECLNFKFKDVI